MLKGTDLSKYNTGLLYDEMAKDIKFGFIRATQGNNIQDVLYKKHKENLDRLSIPWGAYHLYDLSQKVDGQLNNFFITVGTDKFDLQPVMDIELFSWWTKPTRVNALAVMQTFLIGIKEHWNKKPLLYTNPKFIKEVLNNDIPDWLIELCDLWIAHWGVNYPKVIGWETWKFWQYLGEVSNIPYSKNNFDFDYFNGTYEDLVGKPPVQLTIEQRVDRIEKLLNIV